jgi:hypothetical protein
MGKSNSITCDHCGCELVVDSSYPYKFSIVLSCINTGINTTGQQYAIHMIPPLTEDKYFCNMNCLKEWINKCIK